MQQEQLALFGADDVTGSGQLHPWPVTAPEAEAETPVDPDQLAFDDTETGAAA